MTGQGFLELSLQQQATPGEPWVPSAQGGPCAAQLGVETSCRLMGPAVLDVGAAGLFGLGGDRPYSVCPVVHLPRCASMVVSCCC